MSFPGLERCSHGEYRDRYCIKCDLDAKTAEIEHLRVLLHAARSSWQIAEAENERLRGDLFEAHQALLREGMEVNRMRSESVGIAGCAGKFAVNAERSDFEKDMM